VDRRELDKLSLARTGKIEQRHPRCLVDGDAGAY
jgi:hypothetical protein